MRRVAFLPEKLGRAQEGPRHLLPADDVRPLVDQHGQIAPRLNPLLVHHAEDRLGGGPDDQLFLELLGAAPGDPGDLRRKALDVLRLAHQQALGNEEREVRVHVARGLEPIVQLALDVFPDGVAVRPDHHAALDRRVVGQFRLADDVQIPAGEIGGLGSDLGDERVLLFLSHDMQGQMPGPTGALFHNGVGSVSRNCVPSASLASEFANFCDVNPPV